MSSENNGSSSKLAFSLGGRSSKKKKNESSAASGFDNDDEDENDYDNQESLNPDLPREPLVIPVQQNSRLSLMQQQQQEQEDEKPPDDNKADAVSAEDRAAMEALQAEAGGSTTKAADGSGDNKRVIEKTENTFQRGSTTSSNKQQQQDDNDDKEQFQKELDQLAPELSVDSTTYRKVPIAEFGAAMLRGMGWQGKDTTLKDGDADEMSMPRPSRLGLGATPKLGLDAPTHNRRRPRRQDQVQKEKRLAQQQREYEEQRQKQIQLDKQQTIQVGSIVMTSSDDGSNRSIIRQWQGVPGLNMILIQLEGAKEPIKVKRGSVRLIDRSELMERPFQEPKLPSKSFSETKYLGQERSSTDDRKRRQQDNEDENRRKRRDDEGRRSSSGRSREDDRRRRDDDRGRDRRRDEDNDDDYHSSRKKQRRHESDHSDRKRKREDAPPPPRTWLIPNIRVRIISSKYGKSNYKEKGVVVDVSAKGTATLSMASSGQVLHVPERHLETALPKVGGNACILTGKHRMEKGRLLERDSRANKGSVQVFEDMNIVTTSLDDLAEWCGPLDDDLME